MRTKVLSAVLLLTATALAGCGGAETTTETVTMQQLASGKGGIAGLVIDDRYRPIPGAIVVLFPLGLETTADAVGQIIFNDLDPGAYQLRVQAVGHEGAPQPVDVVAGEYTEVELEARRTSSEDGRIVTTEYSVFISCAIDFVANGIVYDCTNDQSGDSDRADFFSDYTRHGANATYLVTEMLANNEDRYEVQVRGCGQYYAVARINGVYAKMTMPYNQSTPDAPVPPEYDISNPWLNDCGELQTILFADSQFREEIQGADPTGIICCGAGAHFGIKAKFVQSLFLGPPEIAIADYAVLKPNDA